MRRGCGMESCGLFCRGERRGQVTFVPRGGYVEVRCGLPDPGDGLYRAFLLGPGGERLLGVLEPEGGGAIALCRRVNPRELASLGRPLRGEARRSFTFAAGADWQLTAEPGALFTDPFLRSRLGDILRAWYRRTGERLLLALPLEEGKPFPLAALFCLARVERVEGRSCAVFTFCGDEPQPP